MSRDGPIDSDDARVRIRAIPRARYDPPMNLSSLLSALRSIAPLEHAEPWDNVGLLIGREEAPLTGPVLLTIDLTERVLDEAIRAKVSAIVAYHPPIFPSSREPISRLTADTPRGRILLGAIEHRIAIYSPHTALDAIPGGITDWLCEGLSASTTPAKVLGDCRALTPSSTRPATQEVKIVTFIPEKDAEKIRNALAASGAGLIGSYKVCSFAAPGSGTFLGDDTTHPTIGHPGRLESAPELRLEMVCSRSALPLALESLRQFHPYETPAIDVYELLPQPSRRIGAGRRLVLDQPATLAALAERLKKHLGISVVNIADPNNNPQRTIKTIGVVPGSGASLIPAAAADHCELFVSGEAKHHEMMDALGMGMSLLLAGHTNTERGYLPRLASRLREMLPTLNVIVSTADISPRVPV